MQYFVLVLDFEFVVGFTVFAIVEYRAAETSLFDYYFSKKHN